MSKDEKEHLLDKAFYKEGVGRCWRLLGKLQTPVTYRELAAWSLERTQETITHDVRA